jgi:hypothetical protein
LTILSATWARLPSSFSSSKNFSDWRIGRRDRSCSVQPPMVTLRASMRRREPPHSGQGRVAMNLLNSSRSSCDSLSL